MRFNVPEATIRRLTHYLRCMEILAKNNRKTIKSSELASFCKIKDTLVRRDLSYFGEFGVKGVGYSVEALENGLRNILGTERTKKMAICGIGNIGTALLNFPFKENGFHIVAGFEKSPDKIGKTIHSIKVYDWQIMDRIIKNKHIEIGVIAVPSEDASIVAKKMIEGGVRGIISFTLLPECMNKKIPVRYVEILAELEILSYEIDKEGGEM